MVGMGCCIADTKEEAIDTMKAGQKYFFEVLGGGIRTAQRLVIQKTRYFEHEESRQNFPGLPSKIKQVPIEERIEKGLLLCGTPDMAIDQLRRVKAELGHGRMNLNIKIGNTPDDAVMTTMRHLKETVFPAVRDL